ncbi:hypothetical protein L873DRAFT_1751434 [Choiromyces venosus 120613-1]|uniref:RNA ligase domain-containing protein n=1 Tax=Choiromyces venosus 120613-1 TaxID=1336337 RepID=A0A3N4J5G3_9PEZI|nr:hypothetical protein L873DRAFT_1751434 [Choiromyces venosus 120613-1]
MSEAPTRQADNDVPPTHTPYPHTLTFDTFVKRYVPVLKAAIDLGQRLPFPSKARFMGTLKLHGYNATIIFRNHDRHNPVFQSRNRVVTSQDAGPIPSLLNGKPLHLLVDKIMKTYNLGKERPDATPFSEIMIAGEVAGRDIYRNVAINRLPRFFCIFNIRVDGTWVDMREYNDVSIESERIFNIMNWPTWEVIIDFMEDTTEISNWMYEMTKGVEDECPFAASFLDSRGRKISGTGEGLVWTMIPFEGETWPSNCATLWNFKTKGEKFEVVSRIKPTPPRDPDAIGLATAFVDYAITEARFEQGIEYLREMGLFEHGRNGKRSTPQFTKWVENDVIEEEWEKMVELGAEEAKVRRIIAERARNWFFSYLEEVQF